MDSALGKGQQGLEIDVPTLLGDDHEVLEAFISGERTGPAAIVGTGLVAAVTAIVNYFSGRLRLPSRAGLLVAAGAAMFAPLAPIPVAVQTLATLTIVALLYIEVKYDSGSETGQPEQAAVDD